MRGFNKTNVGREHQKESHLDSRQQKRQGEDIEQQIVVRACAQAWRSDWLVGNWIVRVEE